MASSSVTSQSKPQNSRLARHGVVSQKNFVRPKHRYENLWFYRKVRLVRNSKTGGSWGYCFLCSSPPPSPLCGSTEGIYGRPFCHIRYCNFQFLTAVSSKVQIFCDVTPYRLVNSKPIFCIIIMPSSSSSESSSCNSILKMMALRSTYPITWRNIPE